MVTITKHVQVTFEGDSIDLLKSMAEICRIKLSADRSGLTQLRGTEKGGELDNLLHTLFDL